MVNVTRDLKLFQVRIQQVQAIRVSEHNIRVASSLANGTIIWTEEDQPYIRLHTKQGTVKVKIGMFLVKTSTGWVGMTAKNFHNKYEQVNEKGDRVPPYTIGTELADVIFPPYDR